MSVLLMSKVVAKPLAVVAFAYNRPPSLTSGADNLLFGSSDDTIAVNASFWREDDVIDGGAGNNTITGQFWGYGTHGQGLHFAPTVHNVQQVKVMHTVTPAQYDQYWPEERGLDFTNWTGLKYAEVHGTGQAGTDFLTRFFNIPLGVKIGVTDFTKDADFYFRGADGTQFVDLSIQNVHTSNYQGIHIQKIGALQVHASGGNQTLLDIKTTKAVAIDGSGNLDLVLAAGPDLQKVDAAYFGGHAVLDLTAASRALSISAGSGGTALKSTGDYADRIAFGSGNDVYKATHLANVKAASGLDSQAVQITNFNLNDDKIDLQAFAAKRLVDPHNLDGMTLADAAHWVADQNSVAGVQTLDVFAWHGSTYLFYDRDGNHQVNAGDGLITLLQVVGLTGDHLL